MKHHVMTHPAQHKSTISRRELLGHMGGGFGSLALAHMLCAAEPTSDVLAPTAADLNGGLHHRARVKRIVQVFMNGGASPMDTFDYKPRLAELNGQTFDPGSGVHVESVTGSPGFKVLNSPFEFKQYGQCGRWVSSVFPHLATCVDDMAFLMSMTSKTNVHGPASYLQNTGFVLPGFPCLGAWISYGLGKLSDNLPTFVVIPDAQRTALQQPGQFFRRLLAGPSSGHDHSPALAESDCRSVSTAGRCRDYRGQPARGSRPAFARPIRRISNNGRAILCSKPASRPMNWPAACSSAPRRRWTYRARRPRCTGFTDWTIRRPKPLAAIV